ncbi:phycobilisome protein, partial [Chroococcidiopsis cubana CCALA 043]
TQGIDTTLYQFLITRMPEILAEEQMALLQPFLAQVEQAVMGTCSAATVPA